MKTKYANTELKCGSTIPGDNDLFTEDHIKDAIVHLTRILNTELYAEPLRTSTYGSLFTYPNRVGYGVAVN